MGNKATTDSKASDIEFTFKVTDVGGPKEYKRIESDTAKFFKDKLKCNIIHDHSKNPNLISYDSILKSVTNGFHDACYLAFSHHCPLILSPDMFWTVIMQGVAYHVNQNAEKCRKAFVSFEGKETITIQHDEFFREPGKNDWSVAFPEFSAQIKKFIGDQTHQMIINDFTTTGPTEKIVSEIVLMDIVKAYFRYEFATECGIPAITLLGSIEDWNKLYEKLNNLIKFNAIHKLEMDFWLKHLEPVMAKVCKSRLGKVDKQFWESLYKIENQSGGPFVTGWISTLVPYINSGPTLYPNPYLDWKKERMFCGMSFTSFPNAVSRVPFVWKYMGTEIKMFFLGGMLGVSQDPKTKAVKPEFGWVVDECQ